MKSPRASKRVRILVNKKKNCVRWKVLLKVSLLGFLDFAMQL